MPKNRNAFSYRRSELREIAQDILDYARKRGASACETDISEGFGQTVTVRQGKVETLEYNRDKGLGVTVYVGQQRGHASSSDFSRAALRATVDAALSIARFTAADPAAGLADPERLWQGKRKDLALDLHHPWQVDATQAAEIAKHCENAAFAVSPQIANSDGASVYVQESRFMAANSLGFCAGFDTSRHSISCSVIAGEGDDMQTGDWYSSTRDPRELADPATIGDYAARRALARLDSRRLSTCELPVIFEAPQACGLLGHFIQAASGGALYRRTSFLLDALGQPVFSPEVSIDELPHIPKALGSTPFDDEGVATRARQLVSHGILQGYFLGSYSARKLGMETTGNAGGCHNLIVRPGRHSLVELAREIGHGLLVTDLMGQGVNYVTGDYSRGAAGYLIENGEISHPVHEITIAGNLREMLRNIVLVGGDTVIRGGKQCPSLVVGKMTIAGQ
ncbi:MAG: metalloprotease PmbA [Candidatus Dactylopiibacterium carminicum]|uniref:Metalloprotease PmbA n=1 Tax=Candidatus Dactylopiibacterium carminicum TaxID=857335 RepID=A0A272ERT2_9RHOO|nr:metalloprotease PmbA [Candidatus Dactylopiibacterium carminicum]KAF7598883.1 metalloprotease PmbA [Candidatus Dactylopiibacterium carminicum]PAS92819.1 MAG: metalloprotease PmbA [Candidatus Dactylopiibacterium carminicum]PAS96271.1 MAG: metalloprotease PmbA [Candidatus Dactylopiibacterium carminicum]PAS98901.1 MAG: metalloprotease PmbA [Candidatus Dactylopiibacterium carminicum]